MVKLFSIKEKYSSEIYKKKKLVEFRRQNIITEENEKCFIYTTSPVKKITGSFVIKKVIREKLKTLWNKNKEHAGISYKEFKEYFKNCDVGTGIFLKNIKKFRKPKTLTEFNLSIPPQSFYNINKKFIENKNGFVMSRIKNFL